MLRLVQASAGQAVMAPSPVVMSKQQQEGEIFLSAAQGALTPADAHDMSQLLPPRPPPLPAAAADGEDAAAAGLMTRVTSLFNRALCKPSARAPASAALADDRHPSLYAPKQVV